MARRMKLLAAISGALTLVFAVWYVFSGIGAVFSLAITFGTFFYHFAMRLAVGYIINALFKNRMNLENPWFRARKFEKKLYIFLRVRVWRKHVPTYAPETFSRELHSWREIAMATCQAEVVHEIIALLSLVPIFFAIPFGEFWVFLITSVLASLFDTVFVILQRYNRPLVLKVMAAEEKRRK
ncbi:MAG: hypothetical protein IJX55_00870 [Clostridia bacterium]|nr:hypothetical protein [Clostridia bacterium]